MLRYRSDEKLSLGFCIFIEFHWMAILCFFLGHQVVFLAFPKSYLFFQPELPIWQVTYRIFSPALLLLSITLHDKK